jgi:lipopolysaccharide transport system permease protein
MSADPSNGVRSPEIRPSPQVTLSDTQSPTVQARPALPRIVIESEETGVHLDLPNLWRYRELLYFLTWRDVKVRYKQTLMGAAWVIVQPLLSMLLFTVLFNHFAGVKSSAMPYPLFAYTGLLLWTFLSNAVTNSTGSLINNANLITKVFFPRMFIPAAAVGAGLVDLGVASVILIGMAVYFGAYPGWSLWLLPVFVLMTATLALAVGLLISALTVKYRDLRHALPFLIQAWMFTSPVIYPVSMVPQRYRWMLLANPFTAVVEGFRAAVVSGPVDWRSVGISALMITVLLVLSVYVFRRIEDTFADLV